MSVDSTGSAGAGVPQEPAAGPVARRIKVGAIAVAAVLFLGFPLVVTDPSTTSIAVFALVFMVAASSWNIFSGYSGYLALGHAVFFGTGGYAVAMAARSWHVAGGWPVFALLPFGGLVAGLVAIPVGLVALRTRRHTFVVVTIAIFFIFQLAAYNLGFTGGTSGLTLPFAPFSAANYNQPFYYVAFAILVLTIVVSWGVRRSRFGLQLLAIRDDEDRALGLGVQTRRVKLTAFAISAVPVGMVGGLYFYFLGQIYPNFAFDPLFDLSIALMSFLGGLGTIVGPLLGALVLESLQQYLTQTFSSDATYLIAYGVLFLLVILVLPRGVVPGIGELLERRRTRAVHAYTGERDADGRDTPMTGGVAGAA
jgi:branched-chain amino acid transport system permease protein